MPLNISIRDLMMVLAAVSCGLALLKGASPERIAALLIAADWLAISLSQTFLSESSASTSISAPAIVTDLSMSLGLLWLALRYNSLWLGAAMIVQGGQLALYASFLGGGGRSGNLYAAGFNLASVLLLLSLLCGTLVSWSRRVRARRHDAELSHA